MAAYEKITPALGVKVYFCGPCSPWQRPSNENTNGLLRAYFPKNTDLSLHSRAVLLRVEDRTDLRLKALCQCHFSGSIYCPQDHLRELLMPTLTRQGDVHILDIGDSMPNAEHRFDLTRIAAVTALLDEVAASSGPGALVTTASGKFYSNGLAPESFAGPRDQAAAYLGAFERLTYRLLTFELPTIAAIQGHAYAGGMFFALSHDVRLMRADRGFMCFPEVALGLPIPLGLASLAQAKLTSSAASEALVLGRRFDAPAGVEAGIIEAAVSADELLPHAIERASELATKRGPALASIKHALYSSVVGRRRDEDCAARPQDSKW